MHKPGPQFNLQKRTFYIFMSENRKCQKIYFLYLVILQYCIWEMLNLCKCKWTKKIPQQQNSEHYGIIKSDHFIDASCTFVCICIYTYKCL